MRLVIAAVVALVAAAPAAADPLQAGVFAPVPDPGLPEGIAVDTDRTVYVSTNPGGDEPGEQSGRPSAVLSFTPQGVPLRRYAIAGEDESATAKPAYGLQALAFDSARRLYVVAKAPARVVRLDTGTGAQTTYARFPDVPRCASAAGRRAGRGGCSPTGKDLRAFPDGETFGPDGSLYVTDFQQALVWRVPPGGGRPRIALSDPRLDTGTGPNGIAVDRGSRHLVIAQTRARNSASEDVAGKLLTAPLRSRGRVGRLRTLWTSRRGDGPDGFAIGASGRIYLAGAIGSRMIVVSARGRELRRSFPSAALDGGPQPIPYDYPGSVAFLGTDLLVTNHAVASRNPAHFAVLRVPVGERGLPPLRPRVP